MREGLIEVLLKETGSDSARLAAFRKSIHGITGVIAGDRSRFDGNAVRALSIPVGEIGAEMEAVVRGLQKDNSTGKRVFQVVNMPSNSKSLTSFEMQEGASAGESTGEQSVSGTNQLKQQEAASTTAADNKKGKCHFVCRFA